MKTRFYLFAAVLASLLLFSSPVRNADAAGDIWANRIMLPPGTNYTSMQAQQNQSKTCDAQFDAGDTHLTATADSSGRLYLYLKTNTADGVDITVCATDGAVLAQLFMVPRTYFTYAVYGLTPEAEYHIKVTSAAPGALLAY